MKRPNIIFITTDQLRADSVGYAGHVCARTPHIDMLTHEAVVFEQAYSDCPVCIPARTTMITGIQSHHYGMPSFAKDHRIERERALFLGSLMTRAGYQTMLVGKSHWHTEPSFRAGFETWSQFSRLMRKRQNFSGRSDNISGIGANDFSPTLSPYPREMNTTVWAVDESLDLLQERDQTQPFFLWTSLTEPHPKAAVHEPYYSMYDNEDIPDPVFGDWASDETCPYALRKLRIGNAHAHLTKNAMKKARGVYYGMITNIDHQVNRLFQYLRHNGLWENTIIVYTADHGEHLGDHGTFFKSSFLESSARLPMIVYVPKAFGGRQGVRSRALVQLADLLPTFCEIAGIEAPEDVDGRSIMPLLKGETKDIRVYLHGQIDNCHMFHTGEYKYLYFADDGKELLFQPATDPNDLKDLSNDKTLLEPIRKQFIEHLQRENHLHVTDEGTLTNYKKKVQPEDYANVLGWMG